MTQHLNAPVPFQDAPEPLRPLLARGLAKDPGRRLWNAGEFVAELERHAVAAYGPDWERRGVRALAAAVAALASAVPLAMLGSFAAEGAMPAAPATSAAVPLQQSAASHSADAVARHGRGFVRRAGGTKTVIAAAAAIGAAAAIAGGFVIADRRSGTSTEVSPSTRAGGGGSPTATATAGGRPPAGCASASAIPGRWAPARTRPRPTTSRSNRRT
ncbi:hypothetical protein [Actinomadura madurae]|uniref:hypothetical protein n=1 Tax=Actinomadura madurae TaxID=1993 RepID=UPI0020D1F7E4|nr:hypothetical protein [Actinomadura madurae]MCQ0015492.1 hypothetical protein [Actinomadura madurae]